ncbi:hypothetical protein BDZ97DRAFT_1823173 [Flammula alnicola]|nr:hypothetical protein BDZ97DRAFT_1823173 [Flammula alnicola]
MLKAITRADVHWYKWIPIIRFSPATHAERASERLDARTSWLQKTVAFAVLSAIFYLVSHHEFYVIYPHGPKSPIEEGLATFTIKLQSLVVLPAAFLGKSLQLILNFRAKTFAGTYRPCALLFLVGATLIVAASAPHVVGDTKIAPGINLFSFSELVLAAILTLQAAIYPPVLQLEEDENTK